MRRDGCYLFVFRAIIKAIFWRGLYLSRNTGAELEMSPDDHGEDQIDSDVEDLDDDVGGGLGY
jgi:hypothetical protein